jgi:eukaryotic-like serine/threonine-protein kinase
MAASDSPASQSSIDLLRLLAAGDEGAAAAVFERYAERLTRLARSRLATRLAQRIDAEDVVMSAYRSFFVAARQGRFELERGGDLWRLLVEVTLHKLYRSAQHHQAQRRSIHREVPDSSATAANIPVTAPEPTPEEVAIAAEELEAVLERLPARSRQALELRLQGFEHEEIAERLACNERTVRRWLNEARRIMAARGGHDFIPSAARRGKQCSKPIPVRPIAKAVKAQATLKWGDYMLRQQIGAGATGKVYRALDRNQNRDVAIKFLKKSLATSPSMIERFVREARTVAELDHPGIVAVHGIGQTPGGGLFLVMDLVRGRDLDFVRRAAPVDPLQAAAWVADAARIVHSAHEQGVIHCDLKPSNLLLDEAGRILVTDFGLAIRSDESAAGVLAGTPAFMAPEQVDPVWGEISPRTDVWGLGGVLYFLIASRPPHTGSELGCVLASIVSAAPVIFPAPEFGAAPQEVLAALRQCLAKRPDDRLSSAIQLADRLHSQSTPSGSVASA